MKILTKAYNNTDWLNGTDLIIWNLDEQLIKEIKLKSTQLIEHFPNDFVEIKKYNMDFEVYSLTDKNPKIINDFIKSEKEFQVIQKSLKLKKEYDVDLTTYLLNITKNYVSLLCYGKYDSCIEVYSDGIVIKEL